MKQISRFAFLVLTIGIFSCSNESGSGKAPTPANEPAAGQSAVQDNESAKDVLKIAQASKDHSTLVAAIKKAGLVDALSNAGPFTVFAPTNAAFDKLPKGTLEELLKPENKEKLQDILQYHVFVGSLHTDLMQDGQTLNEVNGANLSISKTNGQVLINHSARILASIPASNGIIHVIDGVLLPPQK
ncbi:MAG: fasciclin domain-containing protein [Flavisolibacter sp.]